MDMTPQTWPEWYDGRHINEVLFCQRFLDKHPMKCVRGRLFTVDGLIEDEGQIGNLILEEISGVLTSGLSKVVTNLLASIKLQAYSPPLPIETDCIHVANGTYFMDGSFTADKSYCNNRLTVSYNPNAPAPNRWLQFSGNAPTAANQQKTADVKDFARNEADRQNNADSSTEKANDSNTANSH